MGEEGIGVRGVVEGEDERALGRGQRVVLGQVGEVGHHAGRHAQEPVGDGRLARAADADEGADAYAASPPPLAQGVELGTVLPVAGAQQPVGEVDP